jgi:lysophospholipid acyltransferase
VNIKGLLTSYRVKDFLGSWNMSVHEWLKYYVYLRLLDSNKRGSGNVFAALVSFLVSAIWHGFYPGFYSFFIGVFVVDYWNKLAQTTAAPHFTWVPIPI